MLNRRRPLGFTLIELMITVAIVAILAAVAYPSFIDQVRKSRRAAAQSVLMEVAAKQHQLFLDMRSYASAANASALAAAPLKVGVPSDVSSYYDLDVAVTTPAAAPPTFTARAIPKASQSSDKCGTMTLTETGTKTAAVSNCW
jgi:type IV pilus assembly protein PilE